MDQTKGGAAEAPQGEDPQKTEDGDALRSKRGSFPRFYPLQTSVAPGAMPSKRQGAAKANDWKIRQVVVKAL